MSIPEKMLVRVLLAGVKGDWKLLQSWVTQWADWPKSRPEPLFSQSRDSLAVLSYKIATKTDSELTCSEASLAATLKSSFDVSLE